ncbi:hypothetical protein VNO78_11538 [Psophocarpus tetragonolobus]|uniref:Uncharacterized protein n=1 Tax=Psophocarpus tetragonolobus TaxID=3891 RepID=A0AAN9SLY5_PSOTE
MANSTKILIIVLFLVLIFQGNGTCLPSDISVRQAQTGIMVKGKSEWSVTVINKCECGQKNVILSCPGFQTVEYIDLLVLTPSIGTGYCLIKPGQIIYKDVVNFKYAWDYSFSFNPISSQSTCS